VVFIIGQNLVGTDAIVSAIMLDPSDPSRHSRLHIMKRWPAL